MAFSPEEIEAAITTLGVFDPADVSPLAQYLYPEYEAQREALVVAYYETLVNQLRGYASQEILDNARALAETAADSLLRTVSTADLNAIGGKIADGIAMGQHPREIARALEEVQGLDSNRVAAFEKYQLGLDGSNMTDTQIAAAEERKFQQLLKQRRETIANTEANFAVSRGDKLEALRSGKRFKAWQTTGDEAVSDECQANEAQGPIPIGDTFESGVETTPQHPNCRCAVTYIEDAELLPTIEDLSRQAAEDTAAAKENKT